MKSTRLLTEEAFDSMPLRVIFLVPMVGYIQNRDLGLTTAGVAARRPPPQPHAQREQPGQRLTVTGTPGPMRAASQRILPFARRTQPCEIAVPSVPPMFATP